MTSFSRARLFPPVVNLQISRAIYREVTGTMTYQTGWPVFLRRAVQAGRRPSAGWSSSLFALSFKARQWTSTVQVQEAVGRVVVAGERNFQMSDSTVVSLGVSLDPFTPLSAGFTISATQSWADLISGGLAITLSTMFSLGGVQVTFK